MEQKSAQNEGQQEQYYPPVYSLNQQKADLLDKIKPDIIIEILRHRLMGEDLINGTWVKLEELKSRALSSVGAWEITNLILGVSNQNTSISKLNDSEIRQRAVAIARQAQRSCLKNWREYGIKGIDQLGYVNEIVFSLALITLKQPEHGGIRSLISGITTEQRIINENQQEKKGALSWLRRR